MRLQERRVGHKEYCGNLVLQNGEQDDPDWVAWVLFWEGEQVFQPQLCPQCVSPGLWQPGLLRPLDSPCAWVWIPPGLPLDYISPSLGLHQPLPGARSVPGLHLLMEVPTLVPLHRAF